ncbi:Esterase EstB [Planctomycetes bacterium Pan216]|uniref:Esterase EstB n=1 Tax=Kolteria novifilia TaxID=2527975 RepID=A0A518B1E6_9BACT|nr:Esterase EstB [Planctomycetes bacterium Pan216]
MTDQLTAATQLIEEGIASGLHLGAQLYVSHRGRVVTDLALGESSPGTPMTPDSIMVWLSATKPMVAVMFAKLWTEGLVALDAPVADVVPEFAQHGKETITFRHLLTHTAGLRPVKLRRDAMSFEEQVEAVCATTIKPNWRPGYRAAYDPQFTWLILGEAIRRLRQRPLSDVLRKELFEPLGMSDCWLGMPDDIFDAVESRIGAMPRTDGGTAVGSTLSTRAACTDVWPAGGAYGPMRQLANFYEMLLRRGEHEGTAFLSSPLVEAITARHRVRLLDENFKEVIDWGLGFVLDSKRADQHDLPYGYGPHASPRTFGHSGYQSSCAYADPEHDLVVAFVFNGMPGEGNHRRRARELNEAIYVELGLGSGNS